jgi:hypothetical protein
VVAERATKCWTYPYEKTGRFLHKAVDAQGSQGCPAAHLKSCFNKPHFEGSFLRNEVTSRTIHFFLSIIMFCLIDDYVLQHHGEY